MRMPIGGGETQVVFREDQAFTVRCGTRPGTVCVLVRRKPEGSAVSLFDPITGIESGVVKTGPDDQDGVMSPDGQHIAFLLEGSPRNRIRVADLHGVTERTVTVAGEQYLSNTEWDASGTGFFVCSFRSSTAESRLLHVRLDGAFHVLMEQRSSGELWAIPSPNGRQIATIKSAFTSNIWMVENR
jgi:hypothetical protein